MRLFLTTVLASLALSSAASAQVFPPIIPILHPVIVRKAMLKQRDVLIKNTDLVFYSVSGFTQRQRHYVDRLADNCQTEISTQQPKPIDSDWAQQAREMCVSIDFRFAQQLHLLPHDVVRGVIDTIVVSPAPLSPVTVTPPVEEVVGPPCCTVPAHAPTTPAKKT